MVFREDARERLEMLAKRLELEAQRERVGSFWMDQWAIFPLNGAGGRAARETIDTGSYSETCGSSACAAGLATTIPELRRAGFKLVELSGTKGNFFCPAYRGYQGYDACAEFFGLSLSDAYSVFDPSCYCSDSEVRVRPVTPMEVADRIRELLSRP